MTSDLKDDFVGGFKSICNGSGKPYFEQTFFSRWNQDFEKQLERKYLLVPGKKTPGVKEKPVSYQRYFCINPGKL